MRAAIDQAIAFLEKACHSNGFWQDFRLAPGTSDEWVTAYVGTALSSIRPILALRAWNTLVTRFRDGGWGYNALTPRDADSTIWALRLARSLGVAERDERAVAASQWLERHRCTPNGITTYADETIIRKFIHAPITRSFVGWCSPHVCVTANGAVLPHLRYSARALLQTTQRPNGSWGSYWWCEDEYATTHAALALREQSANAVAWAVARVMPNGAVPSFVCPEGSPFATALVLQLLSTQPHMQEVVWGMVDWLLHCQDADGAWGPAAGLRVPPPDVIDPSLITDWELGGVIEGAVTLDHNRVFTTATVLYVLDNLANQKEFRS